MSLTFSRSLRSLRLDDFRFSNLIMLAVAALLLAWLLWLILARVAIYEITNTARLEVDLAVHPVAVQFGGRVVQTRLELGKEVRAGDILVELDTEEHKLHLEEQRGRLTALQNQLAALNNEVRAQERATEQEKITAQAALAEAQARTLEAETVAKFSEQEAQRKSELFKRGLIAQAEFQRAESETQKARASVEALRLAVARLQAEQKAKTIDQQALLERLSREAASLSGAIAATQTALTREQLEISERYIRAPISGRIGELAEVRPGAVVREGDKLATIVPHGEFRIVADYAPGTALGRIAAGQNGRIRLHAFPWTQYGTLPLRVTHVASEPKEGKIRVELAVQPVSNSAIALQHGLVGAVEVEVGRVSPATLILRSAVQLLDAPQKEAAEPE